MLYRSIDCPSKDCNTCEAMNGCVYFMRKLTSAGVILSFVGGVQVSVTQNRDYLMFNNSHYLKTRA